MSSNNSVVKLRLVNHSNDQNNSEYVLFQMNVLVDFEETVVAWTVVQNLGIGDYHPIIFPRSLQVNASDTFGNYTPQMDANPGQAFEMQNTSYGNVIALSSNPASSSRDIEIINALDQGAINANCYRDGKLLATTTSLAPGQKARFMFEPIIWIAAVSSAEEGELLGYEALKEVNTKFTVHDMVSADIVITGGGIGKESTPLSFSLENTVYS